MSRKNSEESKSAEITIILSNFQGLQYDIDEDTEYEVIASYIDKILSNDRIQINHKSPPEIIIKIPIDTENENEISSLFLNPLRITLNKYENETFDTVGYCSMDLWMLYTLRADEIKMHKQFKSEKMVRKMSVFIKAFTLIPLKNERYENCLNFSLNSVYSFQNYNIDDGVLIGLNTPFKVCTKFKNLISKILFFIILNSSYSKMLQ